MTGCRASAGTQASREPFGGAQPHWLRVGGDACAWCGGRA